MSYLQPIHVVVVNWNRAKDTIACLVSLQHQEGVNVRIVLVDNGSTESDVSLIRSAFTNIEVLELERNLGFAAGCNVGIRHVLTKGARYILLLNNDTLSAKDMIEKLLAAVRDEMDIVAPLIYFANSSSRIWSSGASLCPLLLALSDRHQIADVEDCAPLERDILSGCALLVQRAVFERVGLFDERFFMYYEDFDFCIRARVQGCRLRLVPAAHLWHKVSQSSGGAGSPNERYYMALSGGLFFKKHMRGVSRLIIPPYRFLSALRWTMRLARSRSWAALAAYWCGLFRGWLGA